MICFALAKGDALRAKDIFWNMPMAELWMQLWCYYKYNDVKLRRAEEVVEDIGAILKDE